MIRFCFIDSTFLLLEKQSAIGRQCKEKRPQRPTEVDTLLPPTPSERRSRKTHLSFGLRKAGEPPALPESPALPATLSSMTRGFSLRRPQTSDRCL